MSVKDKVARGKVSELNDIISDYVTPVDLGSWEFGSLLLQDGSEYSSTHMIRTGFIQTSAGVLNVSKINTLQRVSVFRYDTNKNFVSYSRYFTQGQVFECIDGYIRFGLANIDDSVITSLDVGNEFKVASSKLKPDAYTKYSTINKGFVATNGIDALSGLTSLANGIDFTKKMLDNSVKLFGVLSHDSTTVLGSNGKSYTVSLYDSTGTGDNPSVVTAKVCLAVCDYTNITSNASTTTLPNITVYDVAKNGDTVGALTITSGAGMPNCVMVGTNLVILISAVLSDGYGAVLRRVFDTTTNTFGPITKCSLNISGTTYDFDTNNLKTIASLPSLTGVISINANIGVYNGTYYIGVCDGTAITKSVILSTTDLDTFTSWGIPQIIANCSTEFECACHVFGGYLYCALRQVETNGYLIISKQNITNKWSVGEIVIPDCGARPCFYDDGTNLYLIHSTSERMRLEIVRIDTAHMPKSYIVAQGNAQVSYPSVCVNGNELVMSYTNNAMGGIVCLARTSIGTYTPDVILNKISALLKLIN